MKTATLVTTSSGPVRVRRPARVDTRGRRQCGGRPPTRCRPSVSITCAADDGRDGEPGESSSSSSGNFEKAVELASSPLVYITAGAAIGVKVVSEGQDRCADSRNRDCSVLHLLKNLCRIVVSLHRRTPGCMRRCICIQKASERLQCFSRDAAQPLGGGTAVARSFCERLLCRQLWSRG